MVKPVVTVTDEDSGQVLFVGCFDVEGDSLTITREIGKAGRLELAASDMSVRFRRLGPLPPPSP